MRMVLRLSETDGLLDAEVAAGSLTGTNPGVAGVLSARCASLIQRRTMLALRPLSSEIRETEAPGSRHLATTVFFKTVDTDFSV